jgi:hypothetical protein
MQSSGAASGHAYACLAPVVPVSGVSGPPAVPVCPDLCRFRECPQLHRSGKTNTSRNGSESPLYPRHSGVKGADTQTHANVGGSGSTRI